MIEVNYPLRWRKTPERVRTSTGSCNGNHRTDVREDRTDTRCNIWNKCARRHSDESGHQRVLDHILSGAIPT